jgi:hypothetical protein
VKRSAVAARWLRVAITAFVCAMGIAVTLGCVGSGAFQPAAPTPSTTDVPVAPRTRTASSPRRAGFDVRGESRAVAPQPDPEPLAEIPPP